MEPETKPKHGGKREGAGRKPQFTIKCPKCKTKMAVSRLAKHMAKHMAENH